MKQVSIGVVAAVLVGALLAGFMLGRFVGHSQRNGGEASVANSATSVVVADRNASSVVDGHSPGSDDGEATPLTPATPANSTTGSAGKVETTSSGMQASGGPRVLPEEDLKRFDKWKAMIRADGGVWADLLELSETEEQDDGARRLEQLLTDAFRRHGGSYTELYIAPPHCTRSVCILRAIGEGAGINPRSDWQAMFRKISSEPWYRQAFDDMSMGVTHEGGDTIYLATLVRCEPGTCRFAGS